MVKEPITPKKATKPVKAGIVKRTPIKAKVSLENVSSSTIDRDLVFMWKCVKMSTGMKIDWPAVAKDVGKSVGTVQKQWSRLNIKLEKSVPALNANDSDKDANDANDEE
ncbi:hypothetical protein N7449_002315 [Penicillium cf. viridicatum]|uniref:Myb-like DNA-binding domain-containing protein n=1 Tax=Penicillium cf. viridicatum TaxID=2972119 RepID=A0A9W9T3G7_9EURO|nr:hypothetical protein N7449_002315 [Penicillium cf. viridicatum]